MSAIAAVVLAGCSPGSSGPGTLSADPRPAAGPALAIVQDQICESASWKVALHCKPGQKIIFLPPQFGNVQLPVMFAGANCDLRYSVVATSGAVTCIFLPIRLDTTNAAASGSKP